MENANLGLLQLFYAGVLVEAANNYEQLGVTEQITEKKRREQAIAAPVQLTRLGAQNPAELFTKMKEVFGCVNWQIEERGNITRATGSNCLMCAIAKKTGSAKPCNLYCINPMKAFGEAMRPAKRLNVEKTLWESDECVFIYEEF